MFSPCKYAILGFLLIVNLAGLVQAADANQTSNGSSLIVETVQNLSANSSNITTIVLSGESIQAAIQASLPGNVIEVHSGTYHETINVTKRLVIRGVDVGGGLPVVDAGGKDSAINISADGVQLENLEVVNSSGFDTRAGIKVASKNCIIMSNNVHNNHNGIALLNSDNNTLSGNNLSNNFNGIDFDSSSNNTLTSNNLSNNDFGVHLISSQNNTLASNNLSNNGDGIDLSRSDNNTILRNKLSHSYYGIELSSSSHNRLSYNNYGVHFTLSNNNTLASNNLSNNNNGIDFDSSSNNTLTSNNLSNNHNGIDFDSSSNNTLTSNNLSYNDNGIAIHSSNIYSSCNNTLYNNNLSNNDIGIVLSRSDNNTLLRNNLSNNSNGIRLARSSHNRLSNNLMVKNKRNFEIDGSRISDFDNDIDATNLINGRPIYYLRDISNKMIDSKSSVILVGCFNCTNVTVRSLIESDNDTRILLVNTHHSKVIENHLRGLQNDIELYFSNDNTLISNNLSNNGIDLYSSSNNTLISNNLSNNGIHLQSSSNNTLISNNLCNYGIYLDSSSNNTLVSNNLSNNDNGVYFSLSNNNILISNSLSNNYDGVYFTWSNNNTLISNNLSNNDYGVYFTSSQNNTLASNNLSNNGDGISFYSSCNNTLYNNNLSNNNNGISLASSGRNKLGKNLMSKNKRNFKIDGSRISDFDSDIDATNLINGKPIYYLRDANNGSIDSTSNAGLVGCFNCTNITIRGLNISDTGTGIGLYKTNNSTVEYNNLTDLDEGIYLDFSNDNTIKFNTINDSHYGIIIENADNNLVENNSVRNNVTEYIVYDVLRNNKFAYNSENETREQKSPHGFDLRDKSSVKISHPALNEDLISSNLPTAMPPVKISHPDLNEDQNPSSLPTSKAQTSSPTSPKSPGGSDSGGSGVELPKQDIKQPTATEEIGKLIYAQIESLPWGQIVFTPPGKAWKGVPMPVKARISQNLSENISQGLESFPKTERDKIKVSYEMNVQLDGGDFFDISPKVQEAKIIPESGYAEWDWSVTPLYEGTHTLKLTATATINLNENIAKEPDVKVFEKDITVEVDWFREAKKTILGGLNWIILSFAGVLGLGIVNWLSGGILNRIKSVGKKEEKVPEEREKTEV